MCISKKVYDKHNCVTSCVDTLCSVCQEDLFSSTTAVQYLNCGHAIHNMCLLELSQTSFKCPQCKKSLVDMSIQWNFLRSQITESPLEYSSWKVNITCNDCSEKSICKYNLQHLFECNKCNGFNTQLDGIIK